MRERYNIWRQTKSDSCKVGTLPNTILSLTPGTLLRWSMTSMDFGIPCVKNAILSRLFHMYPSFRRMVAVIHINHAQPWKRLPSRNQAPYQTRPCLSKPHIQQLNGRVLQIKLLPTRSVRKPSSCQAHPTSRNRCKKEPHGPWVNRPAGSTFLFPSQALHTGRSHFLELLGGNPGAANGV